ncbi:phospho-N-acetylmuramoyl-pentapeptide-transferase [Phaeovibrio sulfidiphilus]|uniref:Phospho-N-acetylmuramoyl-pentapeptide-transferase n=1 Tax=Phaeovibrio sulfidiphilus TaxID=1220600 RepID=A0A8J6YW35_9PROT|nr:phospho-N-acetylmuramoyl-pentapeptide-transferase [Phaeovibrio sulfidiphilus]MBE1237514.1 phospho-N-acetylmuramoyl-pentapeptide-transferase [Phaeovibrio sulfidiphilus]
MLYYLSTFSDVLSALNVFRYLTFRTGGAVMTALVVSFIIGPFVINWLKSRQAEGQPIRDDGPESHLVTKVGTPTMGGVMILFSMSFATLLWVDLSNAFVWAVLSLTLGYGLIGFADDYLKVTRRNTRGLSGRMKLVAQVLMGALVAFWIVSFSDDAHATAVAVPFTKELFIQLGWFYIPFAVFVMVGSSNAVNLTDGLDGLAIVPVMIAAVVFMLIAYLAGNAVFSKYLLIPYVPGTGELAVFCGAIVGAALGFLWYNAPPAQVFMGDTGSLALGGALGAMAIATRHELVLAIVGGLFVLEAVSVIVQVISFKTTGRRVFRMAPLHHHFEKKGWAESTVVIRFWIIALILAVIGLSTLKLR